MRSRFLVCCALLALTGAPETQAVTLANDSVQVMIDEAGGNLRIADLISGRVWEPDPWEQAAGVLDVQSGGTVQHWKLSSASDIMVSDLGGGRARIVFRNRNGAGEMPAWALTTEVAVRRDAAVMELRVGPLELPAGYQAQQLLYPARHFALKTDVDRGFAVIPFWQGAVMPSFIFPMNGGKFCMWDDMQYGSSAVGELDCYSWHGLTMRWFGMHDERSAALTVIPQDGSVKMQYIANYNMVQTYVHEHHQYPVWPRILALSPVWQMPLVTPHTLVEYHILPGGNHVSMAKRYREIVIREGTFVSLEEKARKNPDVRKLKGALYTGIYGGYPHYVNLPGMAFTFDQIDDMVRDMHDNLGVDHAFIHTWGTFSKYVPVMWPISEELGGAERLKSVVDRVKGYGWLYSAYHSFVSILDHDPESNLDLAPKDSQGRPVIRGGRWMAVDENRWVELAQQMMPKEMAALGQNADVTDIAFTRRVTDGGFRLARYLSSTGLVLGTERGTELLVPWYHLLEGMVAPYNHPTLDRITHPAPLFNLVYHDAIANFGKIQDPNQLTHSSAGDYYVKSLRGMLHGDGPMVFFAPYEYPGVRPYIKFAARLLGPVHQSIGFEELTDHAFLSPDFLVQYTKFANGVEIMVNLGPTPFTTQYGLEMPGYGFRILRTDGSVTRGRFHHAAEVDGQAFEF